MRSLLGATGGKARLFSLGSYYQKLCEYCDGESDIAVGISVAGKDLRLLLIEKKTRDVLMWEHFNIRYPDDAAKKILRALGV